MRRRVMQGINAENMATADAKSAQRPEIGGILLGTRNEDQVQIEDFEPVPCEHRLGPSYLLVGDDRLAMEETIEWFRDHSPFSILGWYRSITRRDFLLEEEALDLLFPEQLGNGDIALLLFPHRAEPT